MFTFLIQHDLHHAIVYLANYAMHGEGIKVSLFNAQSKQRCEEYNQKSVYLMHKVNRGVKNTIKSQFV